MNSPLPPYLIGQAVADSIIKQFGELPAGVSVIPQPRTSWPTECVWLRRLGDFAHVHPVSQPCPQKWKLHSPAWRKPWRL